MFGCKHKWEVIVDETTESKFEHVCNQLKDRASSIKIPSQMSDATRKNIKILQCNKCGKLTMFVTEI